MLALCGEDGAHEAVFLCPPQGVCRLFLQRLVVAAAAAIALDEAQEPN
jgi:hypothetical protein